MLVYQISVAGELQADIAGASDFSLDERRDLTSHRPFFTANHLNRIRARSTFDSLPLHSSREPAFPHKARVSKALQPAVPNTGPYATTLRVVAYPLVDQ